MPIIRKPQSISPTSAPRHPCGHAAPRNSESIAWIGTMAPRDGGRCAAIARAVLPPYDAPQIPVLPVHHGWRAIHSRASWPSRASWSANAVGATPSDSP